METKPMKSDLEKYREQFHFTFQYCLFFTCSSHVLSKVCTYFAYKVRYTNSSTEIPEYPISPEIAMELLMAANFLDC